VCLQDLPVTFCMDRSGLSANDGPTHHGVFDISYLRCLPNIIGMSPKDEDELQDMMFTASIQKHPVAIRYPRGNAEGVPIKDQPVPIEIGKAEVLRNLRTTADARSRCSLLATCSRSHARPSNNWPHKAMMLRSSTLVSLSRWITVCTNSSVARRMWSPRWKITCSWRLRLGGLGTLRRSSHHDPGVSPRLAGRIR